MLSRSVRRFCSAVNANSSLKAAAAQSWESLIDAEWVDNDEKIPQIKEAESVIDSYRNIYDGTHDGLYQSMEALYTAKEAAITCDLYSDHIEHLIHHHADMTGALGNETKIPEGEEKMALDTLREYVQFVNSVENDRIQRKIESQLGRKIILLRMALSIENFSVHFVPVACDRLVVPDKPGKSQVV